MKGKLLKYELNITWLQKLIREGFQIILWISVPDPRLEKKPIDFRYIRMAIWINVYDVNGNNSQADNLINKKRNNVLKNGIDLKA